MVQASDRRYGQTRPTSSYGGSWLSECTSLAIRSCYGCTHDNGGRWQVSDQIEGLALSAWTVVWVSHGGNLNWPFYTCTATESWVCCQHGFQVPVAVGVKSREGIRWLASANTIHSCGAKTTEICKGFAVAVLAIVFLSGESC